MDGSKKLLWVALCWVAISGPLGVSASFARELEGRLGVGYNSEFGYPLGIPGISAKYGLTREMAVEFVGGVATTSPASSVFGVKLFRNLFYENHLNFYFMGGGALLSVTGNSGTELLAGVGAEFFIPGVDSLGLAVETGLSFGNSSGTYAIKTLGVSFLNAGIHFYF